MVAVKNKQSKIIVILLILISIALSLVPLTVQSQDVPAIKVDDIKTIAITKNESNKQRAIYLEQAIVLAENNGNLKCESTPGASGEIGCHQYLPSTWRQYSIDTLGYVAKQTPQNAKLVTILKMEQFIDMGYTNQQIFLIWNTGKAKKCSAGINYKINPKGVPYDSCAYVAKATKYYNQLINNT